MKYAQLIMGLLIGTALGGAVVASTGTTTGGSANKEQIEQIVRETIKNEGGLILEAVQNFQQKQQQQALQGANDALKDAEVQKLIYEDETVAFIGPEDSKKVVVEFFDYNCPACKMQFKALEEIARKDKDIKILFHEYPIFGPQSDRNSAIGLAVFHHYPDKYFAFHTKMMTHEGRVDEKGALDYAKGLGMDVSKITAYADSDAAKKTIADARTIGQKLSIQGTPTLIIGEEIVPHAADANTIEQKLSAAH